LKTTAIEMNVSSGALSATRASLRTTHHYKSKKHRSSSSSSDDFIPLSSRTMRNIVKLSTKKRNRGAGAQHRADDSATGGAMQDLLTNEISDAQIDLNTLKLKRQLQIVFASDENSFLHAIQNTAKHPMPDSRIPAHYYVGQDLERFGKRIVSETHEKEREFERLALEEHHEYKSSMRMKERTNGESSQNNTSLPFETFFEDPTQSDIIAGGGVSQLTAAEDDGLLRSFATAGADHTQQQTYQNENTSSGGVVYSDNSATVNKNLVFPTANPTKRLELYLLAKTIDDMLSKVEECHKDASTEAQHQFMISHLHATHEIYLIALNEITRQVYVTCLERGIILDKIHHYFAKFFDVVMEIIQQERKKASDFQELIHEYEKLTNDLAVEKQQQSSEMDRLLKDKTYLFKEREILKRKILTGPKTAPKYDLIIKLLKNTRSRDKLLKSLKRELPEDMRQRIPPDINVNDDDEEDEYFRKFEENDDSDEFFKQFEEKKRTERLQAAASAKVDQQDFEEDPINQDALMDSRDIAVRDRHIIDMLRERDNATQRDIRRLTEILKGTVKKIQELTVVAQCVTNFPVKELADDSILYHTTKKVAPMSLLIETMENINESLQFLTRANDKRKVAIEEENYIHVHLGVVQIQSDDTKQHKNPITISLLTSSQVHQKRADQDSEELYQMISDLRRANAKFKEKHQKTMRRVEELEGELQRRNEQYQAGAMEAEDLRKKYEQEMEQQTMDTINLRNKLEKENEETRQLMKIYEETFQQEKTELVEKIAELEEQLKEQKSRQAPSSRGVDEGSHDLQLSAGSQDTAPKPIIENPPQLKTILPVQTTETTITKATIEDNRPNAPPLIININIGDNVQAEETVEQIARRPGTAHEHIVYIEKIIEKEQTKLRDLFSLLQAEKRMHQIETGQVMGPYSDPHENLHNLLDTIPGTSKSEKSLRPIDQHVRDMEGAFSSKISAQRLAELRQEMSDNVGTTDFGTQVELLHSRQSKRYSGRLSAPNSAGGSPRSHRSSSPRISSRERPSSSNMPLAKNQRLHDIMLKFYKSNTRPKSLLWLLKLISNVYKGKLISDQTEDSKHTLPEFVFLYLKKFYGANALVDEYAGSIMASIEKYEEEDVRIRTFGKFMREVWGIDVLDQYLQIWSMLEGCAVGPEFSRRIGDDGPTMATVSKVRAMHVLKDLDQHAYATILPPIREALNQRAVRASQIQYEEALQRAGFKLKGTDGVDTQKKWGVHEEEALQTVLKAEFYDVFCTIYAEHAETVSREHPEEE